MTNKKHPLDEAMPGDLEARILRNAEPGLARLEASAHAKGWRGKMMAMVFAGGLCAAAAAVLLVPKLTRQNASTPGAMAAADFEMLENLDLLKDMDMLTSQELLERAKDKRWEPKRKS